MKAAFRKKPLTALLPRATLSKILGSEMLVKTFERSRPLSEFRQTPDETIDRLNQTGEAEILTVNGEPCAVLLSPAVYEKFQSSPCFSHRICHKTRAARNAANRYPAAPRIEMPRIVGGT
jgi:hypothetical protein